jgi:predicted dehydrogenase/threonine dehydrogenase-like Zn-dependent dehydrogenase
MKQVLRRGFKDIVVEDVPDPPLSSHHVLVRPCYSLISSGTETASIHPDILKSVANNPSQLKMVLSVARQEGPVATFDEVRERFNAYAVLGYAGAGYVSAKHTTVTDLEIGDRVVYGGEGTGHAETIVTGRNLVGRIPDGVDFPSAAFATLGAIAMNAVRTANIGIGDSVAVIGLGLVGQLIAQLARVQGATVSGFDLRNDRVDLAKRLGMNHGFSDPSGVRDSIFSITDGRGADCVFIAAAAKSDAPCLTALSVCRDRGRIVVVGAVNMSFPWDQMYLKEIQLYMARAYGPGSYDPNYEKKGQDYPISYVRWTENRNMEEFLRLISIGAVDVRSLISRVFPLQDAAAAYQAIMDPASNSLAMVLRYPQADGPVESVVAADRKVSTTGVVPIVPSPGQIQVAIAGAGSIVKWAHLPTIRKYRNVNVRAIYSSSGARAKTYAQRYHADYSTTDFEQILSDSDVNLVVIVSRNQFHAPQSLAALRAGKHVFVEKPMALTIEECQDLYTAARESSSRFTVGFNRRFAPFYIAQKNRLKRRTGPAVVNVRVNSPGISGAYWMADPKIGGAILGEACHFVDLLYWLLDSEPISVYASSLPLREGEPIGQNNMSATFRFADGSIASMTYCTVGSKASAGERVECFAPGFGVTSDSFRSIEVYESSTKRQKSFFADKGYENQMKSFLKSIQEGSEHPVGVLDGMRATLCCLKMLESARIGEPCSIDLKSLIG